MSKEAAEKDSLNEVDFAAICGALLFVIGTAAIYWPLGLLTAGAFLIGLAWMLRKTVD